MTPRKKKHPYAVALGRRGGLKGGKARWAQVPPEERSWWARKAVRARWAQPVHEFHIRVKRALEEMFELDAMDADVTLDTSGNRFEFDFASRDRSMVAEAKAYTWTAYGYVPYAKINELRNAVTRLQGFPDTVQKILVIKESIHPRKGSLADYFVKHNKIGPVAVFELGDEDKLRLIADAHARILSRKGGEENAAPDA
jgi:hypothetical protein